MLMVDFIPNHSEADVLIPTIAESSKSIGEIITTAAAGVLLRGGLSNHFSYTEDGRLVINPASPPDLEQGCEILRRTLEVRETGQKLDNYSAWTLGMLGDELERFFGFIFRETRHRVAVDFHRRSLKKKGSIGHAEIVPGIGIWVAIGGVRFPGD